MELVSIIGEFLAGSHALKSLAALKVVNHEIHEELLPVLYETIIWVSQTSTLRVCLAHFVDGRIPRCPGGFSIRDIFRKAGDAQSKGDSYGIHWLLMFT